MRSTDRHRASLSSSRPPRRSTRSILVPPAAGVPAGLAVLVPLATAETGSPPGRGRTTVPARGLEGAAHHAEDGGSTPLTPPRPTHRLPMCPDEGHARARDRGQVLRT